MFFSHKFLKFVLVLLLCAGHSACKQKENDVAIDVPIKAIDTIISHTSHITTKSDVHSDVKYDHELWTKLDSTDGVVLDIRYATKNNFTKSIIYACEACYLRPEVAKALIEVQHEIEKKGYRLKLFDCYRPRPAQQKLWDISPNASYVTPPTKGSMHNRGLAIDLTLADLNGNEMDMGTPYDYFGVEAHLAFTNLPKETIERRFYLRDVMQRHGFKAIRTEWWHFSREDKSYGFSDWEWPCDQ